MFGGVLKYQIHKKKHKKIEIGEVKKEFTQHVLAKSLTELFQTGQEA